MSTEHRTSRFFDSYAADFSSIYGGSAGLPGRLISRLFRRSMMLRFLRTLEGCRPIEGRSVLDVGCGPGHYSVELARRGAGRVVGIDFAPGMIALAAGRAEAAGVGAVCQFVCADFATHPLEGPFDYVVVMGFMDYVGDPAAVIGRVLSLTAGRAFFSFPADGGFLAWQRKIRYRHRCDLFLYRRRRLEDLFREAGAGGVSVDRIARDFFVTVDRTEEAGR